MHYNYFRDYDAEIGRYLESDPIGLNGGMSTFGYVGGNPVRFVDPYGLAGLDWLWEGIWNVTGGWSPDQSTVDFSAGLGDALLLGFGGDLRELAGVDGGINKCSNAYRYGGYASFAAGGARLAYAGIAKGGALLIRSAPNAVNFRQGLKVTFRGGLFPNFRRKTYEALKAAGKTDAQIIASSGRTNLVANQGGAIVVLGGAIQTSESICGCEQ